MGIDRKVYEDALARMGPIMAIAANLCILENLTCIRNPGGYLRGRVQRDEERQAVFIRLLCGPTTAAHRDLSAENLGNRINSNS